MDDFIEDVFVFNLFEHFITTVEPSAIIEHCRKHGMVFDGLMDVARERAVIIEELASNKLNPFMFPENSLMNTPRDMYIEKVKKVKRCIYDGFLLNTLSRTEAGYITRFGLKANVKGGIPTLSQDISAELAQMNIQNYPTRIITDSLKLKDDRKKDNYVFNIAVGKISVLDGYVAIDDNLLLPQMV